MNHKKNVDTLLKVQPILKTTRKIPTKRYSDKKHQKNIQFEPMRKKDLGDSWEDEPQNRIFFISSFSYAKDMQQVASKIIN